LVLHFFGVFFSDRIPKAKEDANVHLFIYNFAFRDKILYNNMAVKNSCKLYQRIPGTFEASKYKRAAYTFYLNLHLPHEKKE